MPLRNTVEWLNELDGRDRFSKILQYLSLILKQYFSHRKNTHFKEKFFNLYRQLRVARQFFRLFKSLEEYKNIKDFLKKTYHDEFDRMINVIQYFFYCLYWFFDNFTVLCSCKLITWQTKPIYKVAQYCKFLAILQNMLISSRNLLRFHHSEIKLRLSMRESHIERENQESVHKINEIKQRKNILWIHLFKLTCDIIPAIELSDVLLIWTKYRIPEVWIGVAGLISALLTTYYPRLDKNYWQKSLKIVQGNLKTN